MHAHHRVVEPQVITLHAPTQEFSPLLDQMLVQQEAPLLAMILDEHGEVQTTVELHNPSKMDDFEWAMLAQMAWEYVSRQWYGSQQQYLTMAQALGVDVETFNRPKRRVQYCVACGQVGCSLGPQATRDE